MPSPHSGSHPGSHSGSHSGPPHLRLGVSSYSYWHFSGPKVPLETVIERANHLGLVGVEVIQQQLQSEDLPYLKKLRRHAFQHGVALYNLGTSQDFVWDEAEQRRENVAHTRRCLELAHELGASSIRVNAGSWRRPGESGGLLETRGWVTPWAGAAEDEGFAWAIDGLGACTQEAERLGVTMLLENHWGLTTTAVGMLRVLDGVASPWLRAILDTGNFYFEEDMYGAMERVAPWVDLAHAKTYPGGGTAVTIEFDYGRIFGILKAAGFRGYVTLEMEGREHADTAVPKSVAMLREAWDAA